MRPEGWFRAAASRPGPHRHYPELPARPAGECVCALVGLNWAVCRVHGTKPPWAKGNARLNRRMLHTAFPGQFPYEPRLKRPKRKTVVRWQAVHETVIRRPRK